MAKYEELQRCKTCACRLFDAVAKRARLYTKTILSTHEVYCAAGLKNDQTLMRSGFAAGVFLINSNKHQKTAHITSNGVSFPYCAEKITKIAILKRFRFYKL